MAQPLQKTIWKLFLRVIPTPAVKDPAWPRSSGSKHQRIPYENAASSLPQGRQTPRLLSLMTLFCNKWRLGGCQPGASPRAWGLQNTPGHPGPSPPAGQVNLNCVCRPKDSCALFEFQFFFPSLLNYTMYPLNGTYLYLSHNLMSFDMWWNHHHILSELIRHLQVPFVIPPSSPPHPSGSQAITVCFLSQ